MKLTVASIELVGTNRQVEFSSGLNIITGQIATGKSTLLNAIRALVGANWQPFTPELRATTSGVRGIVAVGENEYSIFRPLSSSGRSLLEIREVDGDEAYLLPATQHDPVAQQTYGGWLLEHLNLPRLRVPRAPTNPDSDPTALSIADYLSYGYVPQTGIGSDIFGHRDTFRNIKRRYVFEVLYGIYDSETAELHESFRSLSAKIRSLESDESTLDRLLSGTALGEREDLVKERRSLRMRIGEVDKRSTTTALEASHVPQVRALRERVLSQDVSIANMRSDVEKTQHSISALRDLVEQLQAQAARISRAMVAGTALLDIEFKVCPRCGSSLDVERESSSTCVLCLQAPSLSFDRDALEKERGRLTRQIAETEELSSIEDAALERMREELALLVEQRDTVGRELDQASASYISDHAEVIQAAAAKRASLEAELVRVSDYLAIVDRFHEARRSLGALRSEREKIQDRLERDSGKIASAEARVDALASRYASILESFRAPQLGRGALDRETYLPRVDDRSFDQLSSAGWKTLVNLAYTLAHHEAAIEMSLPLPGLLIIDRPSTHIGHEGLDLERIHAIYEYLVDMGTRRAPELQILVVDNDVPDFVEPYVRLRLSDGERLIPTSALSGRD